MNSFRLQDRRYALGTCFASITSQRIAAAATPVNAFSCTAPVGGDVCLASGNISYSGAGRELRYDGARDVDSLVDVLTERA